MKHRRGTGFLRDVLPEIKCVLSWFRCGGDRRALDKAMEDFAAGFLGAIHHDGALVPTLKMYPPELLARVLTHHETAPEHPIAWLNLGFALRRMPLLGVSDPPAVNTRRLDRALQCFQRSLELEAKNARAWTGCGLVFYQRGDHEREIDCYQRALAIDPSDPGLWLFYCNALELAGRHEEALANVDTAYHYYLLAGQPEQLRPVFEQWIPRAQMDLSKIQ
jgi:tetratricopeptide (TPR) repeat protein